MRKRHALRSSHRPYFYSIHRPRALGNVGRSQSIIITAVCAAVGGVILILILLRIIHKCRRGSRSPAPLPPIQPLAHHRERRVAQMEALGPNRTATWYDSSLHLAAPSGFANSGSSVSLLTKDSSHLPSRHASFSPSETTDDTTGLSNAEPLDSTLTLPPPTFPRISPSSSSLASNSDVEPNSASPTSPSQTPSSTHLSHSTSSVYPHPSNPWVDPTASSPARSASNRRPRPTSMVSSVSTMTTRTSRSTLRGTPHSRHSQVQIVLPAPLAPELFPYMQRDDQSIIGIGRHDDLDAVNRLSVADQWVPVALRSDGPVAHGKRRSASTDCLTSRDPKPNAAPLPERIPRRVFSNPSTSDHVHASSSSPTIPSAYRHYNTAPPVPRIPSMYNTYTTTDIWVGEATLDLDPEHERGRRRSLSASTLVQLSDKLAYQSHDALSFDERSRTINRLQKSRSRSHGA